MSQIIPKITPQQAAIELLRRDRAAESLIDYSKAITIPGTPIDDTTDIEEWVFNPVETGIAAHHVLIMRACQDVFDGKIINLMLLLPPGSAKSTYASIVFPTWAMGRIPGTQIILTSYGADLAKKHGRRARQIVMSPEYSSIFETSISKKTQAADFWTCDNGSEYMSCGILSGITGNRADGVVLDDPIKGRAEADSELIRNRTWDAYQEDLLTRLKPGGWQIMILTRWHEDDPAGRILPEKYAGQSGWITSRPDGQKWYVLCCPAECERSDDPLGREIGETLWPEWFTDGHFDKYKHISRTWNALFQQRPSSEEGSFFKKEWFRRFDMGSEPKQIHKYAASDYAVTDDSGDFTEHGVFGVDHNGHIWLLDWWYGQKQSDVWIGEQIKLIKLHAPFVWFGEAGVIKRAIEPFLYRSMIDNKAYVNTEWIPSVNDKATRARSAQGLAALGKIHIPTCEWGDRIIDQLISFPYGAHDDGVDVLSLFGMAIDKAHPAILSYPKKRRPYHDRRIDELYKGTSDTYADYATREHDQALRELGAYDIDADEYDDGDTVDTI